MANSNLIKAGVLVTDIVDQAQESFSDGFQFTDIAAFADEAIAVGTGIEVFKQAAQEAKTATADEIYEVKQAIKEKLNADDDNPHVEALVNAILDFVASGVAVFLAAKNLKEWKQSSEEVPE